MTYAFKVGDRVIVTPEAFTRAGDSGVITDIFDNYAIVVFDGGDEMGYLLDEGELVLQEGMRALVGITQQQKQPQ